MKVVFVLLFFLVFAESKWTPLHKLEDLPAELQPYVQLQNGKLVIKNGAKLPMLFEDGQFAFKFIKEKCKAGIWWFYTTITGKVGSSAIGEFVYKNSTGEGKVVVMSNGRSILDNQEELLQIEGFKTDSNGMALVQFEIRDPICDVMLSQGKIMVEKTEVQPPVEDVTTKIVITVGCVMGAAVVMMIVTCFLGYWFGYRKKQRNEENEEKVAECGPEDKTKKN